MAPEYAMTGHFSVKSDVYSFGMMVLEIVSAQKNGFARPQDEEPLVYRVSFHLIEIVLPSSMLHE